MQYFGEHGERLQMLFNFEVNQALFYALATADRGPLVAALEATKPRPATAQWAMFLRNHDELDLGRLTEEQRGKVFAAFGPEPRMQLYGRGIRRRLAPMLGGDRRRIELAYSLMMTLPGTVVLEYGDEIGMGDDLSLEERDAVRTPMQWSAEPQGGFTKSDRPALPLIASGPYGFEEVNVAKQRREPNALVNWMERLIRMRKEVPEIGWGDFVVLDTPSPEILALRYDWRNNAVVVLHNLADAALTVTLRLHQRGDAKPESPDDTLLVNLLSDEHDRASNEQHTIDIEPYGYRWYRVGGLDYLLRRSDVDIHNDEALR
jgi:maltose alpha-D-glucosyltransferase/alpha-amylase